MVSLDYPIGTDEGQCLADVIAGKDEGIQASLERNETVKLARLALKGLRREQREVLMLSDMNGLKYGEIALALRIPVGAVRSRIHRARQTFRGMWPTLEIA